ncbi:MAG: hypothetical protein KAT34_11980 [Candidatus Aminicenantes bacterium]|jgi:hypothetical protein|nr:hypothetical protein [Candidatus Aminicenantes bacterium]
MQVNVEREFKEKFRQTFIEMLETDRETLYPLFTEIMEDLALVRAMEEGENTRKVKEENIIGLLQ